MSEVQKMERNYIEGDSVRFTKASLCTVDMEVCGSKTFKNLTPKRLFPMTNNAYITLLDEKGKEVAIIRNLDTLIPESRKIIEIALNEYYFIPKIKKINEIEDKFGTLNLDVETHKGKVKFAIRNRHYDIKKIGDNRILIKDGNDNRYEIEDYTIMDKKSIKLLYPYI